MIGLNWYGLCLPIQFDSNEFSNFNCLLYKDKKTKKNIQITYLATKKCFGVIINCSKTFL